MTGVSRQASGLGVAGGGYDACVMSDWTMVSRRIREARERLGLARDAIAKRGDVTERQLARYESTMPASGPDLDVLSRIAKGLGVDTSWLLFGLSDADTEMSDADLARLRDLNIHLSVEEARWLRRAPNFHRMDALGMAQAILGQRRGLSEETATVIDIETRQRIDPDVPKRRK